MRERIATPTATRITVPITQVNKPPNDFGIVFSPKKKMESTRIGRFHSPMIAGKTPAILVVSVITQKSYNGILNRY